MLPAVTLQIDYSLDTSNFLRGNAGRQAVLNSIAAELGSRLNDSLAQITGDLAFTHPVTDATFRTTTTIPANTIRIYAGGRAFAGSQVGEGGWRTSSLRSAPGDFQPYGGHLAFDTDTNWDFAGTGVGTDFRAVAWHELLHVLGLDHVAQTAESIMRPVTSEIRYPTSVDWAALRTRGWQVSQEAAPGTFGEVMGRTADGAWQVSRNLGDTLSSPSVIGKWAASAGWRDVSTGDFDGDGRTDVVGRTSGGEWYVGLNRHGLLPDQQLGLSNRLFARWNEQAGWRDVRFGDFNADGRSDVAGRTSGGEWYVGLSTGTAFTTIQWARWNEQAGWRDVRVGDFDGDRRADIAGRTSAGEWYVARSTGVAFLTGFWAGWNEQAGWRDVLVADFDGNGRADLAGRSSGGEWYVGLSVANVVFGNYFSTLRWAGWTETAGWRGVTVGNFAGDSRSDLVGRTSTGQWYVAVNIGGISFSTIPYGAWTEGAWQTVLVGDFAGSATTADVLARSSAGTWFLGQNTGSQLAFRSFGQWNEGFGWRDVAASKRLFTSGPGAVGIGASGFGVTLSLSAAGETSASGAGGSTAASAGPAELRIGVPVAIAPSAGSSGRTVLMPPDEDEQTPEDRLASAPPPSGGAGSLFDSAFGDGRLLDALVVAT